MYFHKNLHDQELQLMVRGLDPRIQEFIFGNVKNRYATSLYARKRLGIGHHRVTTSDVELVTWDSCGPALQQAVMNGEEMWTFNWELFKPVVRKIISVCRFLLNQKPSMVTLQGHDPLSLVQRHSALLQSAVDRRRYRLAKREMIKVRDHQVPDGPELQVWFLPTFASRSEVGHRLLNCMRHNYPKMPEDREAPLKNLFFGILNTETQRWTSMANFKIEGDSLSFSSPGIEDHLARENEQPTVAELDLMTSLARDVDFLGTIRAIIKKIKTERLERLKKLHRLVRGPLEVDGFGRLASFALLYGRGGIRAREPNIQTITLGGGQTPFREVRWDLEVPMPEMYRNYQRLRFNGNPLQLDPSYRVIYEDQQDDRVVARPSNRLHQTAKHQLKARAQQRVDQKKTASPFVRGLIGRLAPELRA